MGEGMNEAPEQRQFFAFVAAAQDGDTASACLQGARELFDYGRLAGAADGQVADGNDEAAELAFPQQPLAIEPEPALHDPCVNMRQRM